MSLGIVFILEKQTLHSVAIRCFEPNQSRSAFFRFSRCLAIRLHRRRPLRCFGVMLFLQISVSQAHAGIKSIFDGSQSTACAYRVNSTPIPVISHSDDNVQRKRWLGLCIAFRKVAGAKEHQRGELKPSHLKHGVLKKTKNARARATITTLPC